ncbi:MAG: hypothetical protein GXP25_15390 [Planctomycetes bacterium]|nr:hypothetical protein [Planctomycetota bacterium]
MLKKVLFVVVLLAGHVGVGINDPDLLDLGMDTFPELALSHGVFFRSCEVLVRQVIASRATKQSHGSNDEIAALAPRQVAFAGRLGVLHILTQR